jgi:hypothetical protein
MSAKRPDGSGHGEHSRLRPDHRLDAGGGRSQDASSSTSPIPLTYCAIGDLLFGLRAAKVVSVVNFKLLFRNR